MRRDQIPGVTPYGLPADRLGSLALLRAGSELDSVLLGVFPFASHL